MYLEGVDIGIPIMNTLYCFEPHNDILKQKENEERREYISTKVHEKLSHEILIEARYLGLVSLTARTYILHFRWFIILCPLPSSSSSLLLSSPSSLSPLPPISF